MLAAAPAPVPPQPAAPASHGALSHAGQPAAATPKGPDLPAEAGASKTLVEGCLLAASEEEGARFPAPPITRAGGPPQVTLAPVAGGVVLHHTLTHACCLTVKISSSASGGVALVTETLGGTPCRRRRGSTLRTALRLAPGAWTVALELEESGVRRRVFAEDVRVE